MSISKRVPAVAGGLGAVVLLGPAANLAIGGEHYQQPPSHHEASRRRGRSSPASPRSSRTGRLGSLAGRLSNNLITRDDQVMRVTYGTAGGTARPGIPPSQQHTGAAVPVYAGGPGASAILGTTDHTDLFELLQGDALHGH